LSDRILWENVITVAKPEFLNDGHAQSLDGGLPRGVHSELRTEFPKSFDKRYLPPPDLVHFLSRGSRPPPVSLDQPRPLAGKSNDDPKVRIADLQIASVPTFQDLIYLSV
jgi:hypothetical protein